MPFQSLSHAGIGARPGRAIAAAIALCAAIALGGCSSAGSAAPPPTTASAKDNPFASDPEVRAILVNSCFDCHGDEGSGSFTAKLAPSYLFGSGAARGALNFSDWSELNPKQQRDAAAAVVKVIESGSMPPGDYEFFHPSSELTDAQKQLVTQWAHSQQTAAAH